MTLQEMARKGGQASAKKRLGGKTQSEISQIMRTIRMSSVKSLRKIKSPKKEVENV